MHSTTSKCQINYKGLWLFVILLLVLSAVFSLTNITLGLFKRYPYELSGFNGEIVSVDFSSDGSMLAASGGLFDKPGEIWIWNVRSKKILRTLKGHHHKVHAVAFSPNKEIIASAGAGRLSTESGIDRSGEIYIWDIRSGRLQRILTAPTGTISSIAFSPNGEILASGSWDKKIYLWDVQTGRQLRTLAGHTDSVNSVAFSPDGKILASAGKDNIVKLWDMATGRIRFTLKGHTDHVNTVDFLDAAVVASGSSDTTIRLWDTHTGRLLQKLNTNSGAVLDIDFPSSKKIIASGSFDGIRLWEIRTGRLLKKIVGGNKTRPGHRVNALAFHPSGKLLAYSERFLLKIDIIDLP